MKNVVNIIFVLTKIGEIMTLSDARKNLKVMASLNDLLARAGDEKSSRVLSILISQIGEQSIEQICETLVIAGKAARKLTELDGSDAEAALKYLVDLYVRPKLVD